MTRTEKRKRMKALAIARFVAEQSIKLCSADEWQRVHMAIQTTKQALAMKQTPAKLFRHDKPELDKRKWKRYNRKQMKGAFLLTPHNTPHATANKQSL